MGVGQQWVSVFTGSVRPTSHLFWWVRNFVRQVTRGTRNWLGSEFSGLGDVEVGVSSVVSCRGIRAVFWLSALQVPQLALLGTLVNVSGLQKPFISSVCGAFCGFVAQCPMFSVPW